MFPMKVAGLEIRQKIEVTDCEDRIVLGMDFIHAHVKVIDMERLELKIGDRRVPITLFEEPKKIVRVTAIEDREIPARSELIIMGEAENGRDMEGMLEMDQNPTQHRPWLMARMLVRVESNRVPVRLINVLDEAVRVRRGAHLGILQEMGKEVVEVAASETVRKTVTGNPKFGSPDAGATWTGYTKLQQLAEDSGLGLEVEQQRQIEQLLYGSRSVFSDDKGTLGHTNLVQHEIDTKDSKPIKQAPRRIPQHHREAVDTAVAEMLEKGIIEKSSSPWASPIVLVKKKDGTLRFCVDYRKLNAVTEKDAYPLPRIDDTLMAFQNAQWFSTLDLVSGYWQVELSDDAKRKSAFCIPGGLYQFRMMSFGLCNAPGTFERLMERVLAGLSWKTCLLYIDDIIVYSRTFEEHVDRLREVFGRLQSAGLKLKPSKCNLFKPEVSFLGHIVGRDGIRTDPVKTEAVRTWGKPRNITDVRSFLGLCSYYRKFIPNFSNISAPLTALNEKGRPFVWGDEQQKAFVELKNRLVTTPILGYPREKGRFILDTDASDTGLGAVLSQEQDGEERVIMYLSRSLTKEERRYCVTRKELLAIVYAVQQCKQYLLGSKFLIRTDHGSLTWLMSFKEPQGQVARWIEILSEYHWDIQHRPGRVHQNADGLSRSPCPQCGKVDWKQMKIDAWKEVEKVQRVMTRSKKKMETTEAVTPDGCPDGSGTAESGDQPPEPVHEETGDMRKGDAVDVIENWMQQYTKAEIAEMQRKETWYKGVQQWTAGEKAADFQFSALGAAEKILYGMRKQLRIVDGVVYRSWRASDGADRLQLMAPQPIRREIFRLAHEVNSGGHLGARRMRKRIRYRYFWPEMDRDIQQWILACDECASRSQHAAKKNVMQKFQTGRPMERVAMDIMGPLPRTTSGNKYILVVGDYFTKWIEAYPIPNQEAKTVADVLTFEFVARFGAPMEIHTDQGRNFCSRIMQEVCKLLGVNKTQTTPFRPKSDGFVERFNRTLQQMISLYVNKHQTDWDRIVPLALTAYRATPQDTTGQTPNMLMLGREITLPVDLIAGMLPGETTPTQTEYATELREHMEEVFREVRQRSGREMSRQKKLYDRGKVNTKYKPGDLVWEAVKARKKGKAPKLQRKWRGPLLIVDRYTDVTYLVATGLTDRRVVHFDMLKPYGGITRPFWLRRLLKEIEQRRGNAVERESPETSSRRDVGTGMTIPEGPGVDRPGMVPVCESCKPSSSKECDSLNVQSIAEVSDSE